MTDLPESLFLDPVLTALRTTHAHLSLTAGDAIRYRPDVAPFSTIAAPTPEALRALHSLLAPGEIVWLPSLERTGLSQTDLAAARLTLNTTLDCLQMALPTTVEVPEPYPAIVPLSRADSPAMVALTDVAFPGFFRSRTCEMGHYFGIRAESGANGLIAMGGERLTFPGYSEISGLCTHPDHRGKGHAASLIWEVVRRHRQEGIVSWLHVAASNQRAIDLYRKLGFEEVRVVRLYQVTRTG